MKIAIPISAAMTLLSACSPPVAAEAPTTPPPAMPTAPADAPASPPTEAQDAAAPNSLVRTAFEDTEFHQLFPGVAVHFAYGGMGLGTPTGQVGRIDAGLTFPAHSHSGDYYAVVVKGRFQHWEEGDADKGPIMTPGSTFFQGKDAPHYDSCLGPDQCFVYVTFPERADVTLVE